MKRHMKLRETVDWVRKEGSLGYLFDRRLGTLFGLNSSSAVALEALAAGADELGIVEALVRRCGATELAARDDAAAFLETLMERDLVEL